MLGIGTILSVVGGVSEAINIYKFGSTLAKGSDAGRVLGALERIHATVERLSDNILYAPGIEGFSPAAGSAHRLNGLREVRALLEPVQAALGGEIVSSGLIETPDKMERAMLENPWAVLEDIRPQHLAVRQANPDKVPVLFVHHGVRYIGWQMRGALPVLFNCEMRDLPGLGASLIHDQAPNTATGQTINSGTGTLVVRRPSKWVGRAVSIRLSANGKEIGRVSNNSTEQFTLPAGHILIEAKNWGGAVAPPLDLYIAPGSRTLIEVWTTFRLSQPSLKLSKL
jgi:hypothetical protein